MSNLSNAPFRPPTQQPLSGYSVGALPQFSQFQQTQGVQQEGAPVATQLGNILAYPTDSPKYMMTFSIQQYHRSSYNVVGQFKPSGYPGIALPLPEQMANVNDAKWELQDSGLMSLAASGIGASIEMAAFARGGKAAAAAGAFGADVGGAGATALQAFTGLTPNQFQVMLYRGPTYKQHQFTWQLSPQNFREADIIRMMILTFQNAMAPGIVNIGDIVDQALWAFPMIFRCRIYPNSKWMYKFKPMVLRNFTVNYTPAGRASFNRNVNGVLGENPPEAVTIQAHFIEMEYWVAGNYSNYNDPDDTHLNPQIAPLIGDTPAADIIPSPGGGVLRTQ